jgi:hypothetical protein
MTRNAADLAATVAELEEVARLLGELGVTDQGPRSLGGLIGRATKALKDTIPQEWVIGWVGRYPNGDKYEGLIQDDLEQAEDNVRMWNEMDRYDDDVDPEDRVTYAVERRRPEIPAGPWEPYPVCGTDVPGTVPSWAGEDQIDPCRCIRPQGHAGQHQCSHYKEKK